MKCRKCAKRWTLESSLGPGGEASPGHYSAVAAGLFITSIATGWLTEFWVGLLFGALGILIEFMAICASGYQEPATAYKGSICPKCGQRNWIWPWNL